MNFIIGKCRVCGAPTGPGLSLCLLHAADTVQKRIVDVIRRVKPKPRRK